MKRATTGWAASAVLITLWLVGAGAAVAGERWGWLGVRIRDLAEVEMEDLSTRLGLAEGYGVVVSDVLKETPAEAAGLKAGDLIVAIEGVLVVETRTLQRLVGGSAAGREIRVVVLREGQRRELRARVGEMPRDAVAERVAAEFGFLVRDPTGDEARGPVPFPIVTVVAERSAAARGGLRVNDRIVAIDGREILSVEELRTRLTEVRLRDELRLRVRRGGEPTTLVIPPARSSVPTN